MLLGAVDRIFPAETAGHAPSNASSSSMLGGLLATFSYLFATSLCLGVATGLGIAFLMKRLEGQGVHQVSAACAREFVYALLLYLLH